MTDDVTRRIETKMDRLDRSEFRVPAHGIERYEHHGCRCEVCTAAHVRVERLALRLDNELRRRWGAA